MSKSKTVASKTKIKNKTKTKPVVKVKNKTKARTKVSVNGVTKRSTKDAKKGTNQPKTIDLPENVLVQTTPTLATLSQGHSVPLLSPGPALIACTGSDIVMTKGAGSTKQRRGMERYLLILPGLVSFFQSRSTKAVKEKQGSTSNVGAASRMKKSDDSVVASDGSTTNSSVDNENGDNGSRGSSDVVSVSTNDDDDDGDGDGDGEAGVEEGNTTGKSTKTTKVAAVASKAPPAVFGKLRGLSTATPELHITLPNNNNNNDDDDTTSGGGSGGSTLLVLPGRKVEACSSRFMSLSLNKKNKKKSKVVCKDLFSSVIVFGPPKKGMQATAEAHVAGTEGSSIRHYGGSTRTVGSGATVKRGVTVKQRTARTVGSVTPGKVVDLAEDENEDENEDERDSDDHNNSDLDDDDGGGDKEGSHTEAINTQDLDSDAFVDESGDSDLDADDDADDEKDEDVNKEGGGRVATPRRSSRASLRRSTTNRSVSYVAEDTDDDDDDEEVEHKEEAESSDEEEEAESGHKDDDEEQEEEQEDTESESISEPEREPEPEPVKKQTPVSSSSSSSSSRRRRERKSLTTPVAIDSDDSDDEDDQGSDDDDDDDDEEYDGSEAITHRRKIPTKTTSRGKGRGKVTTKTPTTTKRPSRPSTRTNSHTKKKTKNQVVGIGTKLTPSSLTKPKVDSDESSDDEWMQDPFAFVPSSGAKKKTKTTSVTIKNGLNPRPSPSVKSSPFSPRTKAARRSLKGRRKTKEPSDEDSDGGLDSGGDSVNRSDGDDAEKEDSDDQYRVRSRKRKRFGRTSSASRAIDLT